MKQRLFYRISACMLTTLMTAGLLAGCGANGTESGQSGNQMVDYTELYAPIYEGEIVSKSLPEKAQVPEGTIKILAYEGFEPEHVLIRKYLKDHYNIDCSYTVAAWTEHKQKQTTALAAKEGYDVVIGSDPKDGLVKEISEYIDINEEIFDSVRDANLRRQKNWGGVYGLATVSHPEVLVYNQTMLENNGIKTPLEYVQEGAWTLENFRKVCLDFKAQKVLGDEPFFRTWDSQIFVSSSNADYVTYKDGKYALNLEDPKLRAAVEFTANLYAVDKVSGGWQDSAESNFWDGKQGMIMMRFGNRDTTVPEMEKLKFDWDFVPIPTPDGDLTKRTAGTRGVYAVGAGSHNPVAAAAYVYLFVRQDILMRPIYMQSYFTDEQIERFTALQPIAENTDVGPLQAPDELIAEMRTGRDFTNVVEELRPIWQDEIDKYNEK